MDMVVRSTWSQPIKIDTVYIVGGNKAVVTNTEAAVPNNNN